MACSSWTPPGLWQRSASHTTFLSALLVQRSWRIDPLMIARSLCSPTTSSRPSLAFGSSVAPAIFFWLGGTTGSASLLTIQTVKMACMQPIWPGGISFPSSQTSLTPSSLSFDWNSTSARLCTLSTTVSCLSQPGGLPGTKHVKLLIFLSHVLFLDLSAVVNPYLRGSLTWAFTHSCTSTTVCLH